MSDKTIQIKYWPGSPHLTINPDGSWIDLYTYKETVLRAGQFKIIPLGVAMKLPDGYEAHVVSRSSTFKRWGIMQTNALGIIDPTYCGSEDQWGYPALATKDVTIPAGTRLCQFRIEEVQPDIIFQEVVSLEDASRGGFGTSGA